MGDGMIDLGLYYALVDVIVRLALEIRIIVISCASSATPSP